MSNNGLPGPTASMYAVQKAFARYGVECDWHDNVPTPMGNRPAIIVGGDTVVFCHPKMHNVLYRITGQLRVGLNTQQVAFYARNPKVLIAFYVQDPHEIVFVQAQKMRDLKDHAYLPAQGGQELAAFIDRKDCIVYPCEGPAEQQDAAFDKLALFILGEAA